MDTEAVRLWRQLRDHINKMKPGTYTLLKVAAIVGYIVKEENNEKR